MASCSSCEEDSGRDDGSWHKSRSSGSNHEEFSETFDDSDETKDVQSLS